jgi:hypothetical protein
MFGNDASGLEICDAVSQARKYRNRLIIMAGPSIYTAIPHRFSLSEIIA